ncbi:RAD2 [Auxenochlorella protothecoides x Auxenochlorella symbiontica]
MGIQGLTKLLADNAPGCMKEQKFENYFGRKIAVDASMHIYAFMVVVGRTGDQTLTDEAGNVTSHLQGMFFRTVKMLESGMKPVFVFDGKAPTLKSDELAKRYSKRQTATTDLETAKETGTKEDVEKYSKRTVRVTREHNAECRRLLQLLGVPIIDAPSEAEAQCASLCSQGLVYGIATEDMDALTFATPRLIRHLMSPAAANKPVTEFEYDQVLAELDLTADQFIDLCILCGCDYTEKIGNIGPFRALQLIKKHGSLEATLAALDPEKYNIPEPFPYKEAKELFLNPEVLKPENIPPMKWTSPDLDGLLEFLVKEKSFNEERVRSAIQRVTAAKSKSNQGRLDSFFGPSKTPPSQAPKRKEAGKVVPPPKKGKLGGFGKKK